MGDLSTILLIGKESNKIVLKNILADSYLLIEAKDGYTAKNVIAENNKIAAVLFDIDLTKDDFKCFMKFINRDDSYKNLPVIALIEHGVEESLNLSLDYDIADYLSKPYHEKTVKKRLSNLIKLRMALTKASLDSLTKLLNRTAFQQAVDNFINNKVVSDDISAMLLIDIDNFKQLNDLHGHAYGDNVLIEFSNVLRKTCGKNCYLARLGGDEFIIWLKNMPNVDFPKNIADNIMKNFSNNLCWSDGKTIPTCSIGISLFPYDGKNRREMYFKADEALYQAKHLGRNQYVYYKSDSGASNAAVFNFDDNIEYINDLKRQLELYRSMKFGGVFSFKLDEEFTLIYANDKYYEIHDYTKETFKVNVNNKCRNLIHPDDIEAIDNVLSAAVKSNMTDIEFVMRIITGKQQIRYILCSGSLEYNIDDEIIMNSFIIDITEKKLLESSYEKELVYRQSMPAKNLLVSLRVNLATDVIEDARIIDSLLAQQIINQTYSNWIKIRSQYLYDIRMRSKFLNNLSKEALLLNYQNNDLEKSFEYQTMLEDNRYHWISVKIKLFPKPNTKEIVAFVYTYDIDKEKLLQQIMDQVISIDYDYLAFIDAKQDYYMMFANSQDERMPESLSGKYEAAMIKYTKKFIEQPQQADLIMQMRLRNILEELKTKKIYEINIRMLNQDKSAIYKKIQFSYIDEQKQTLLLTRRDVTRHYC